MTVSPVNWLRSHALDCVHLLSSRPWLRQEDKSSRARFARGYRTDAAVEPWSISQRQRLKPSVNLPADHRLGLIEPLSDVLFMGDR